jgi:hypothetical protein
MSRRSLLLVTLAMLFLPERLPGQEQATADSPPTVAEQRQKVLGWLESYVGNEVLLKPDGLSTLIERVRSSSDGEFAKWYQETRRLREIVQSPEWLETRQWMREFLAAQAMYSDEELEQFRVDIARMTPDEVTEVIERIGRKRQSLIWARRASQRNRRASLALSAGLMQQQRLASPAGTARPAWFGPANRAPLPRKSTYAERRNSFRRNFYIWPGWPGWWFW